MCVEKLIFCICCKEKVFSRLVRCVLYKPELIPKFPEIFKDINAEYDWYVGCIKSITTIYKNQKVCRALTTSGDYKVYCESCINYNSEHKELCHQDQQGQVKSKYYSTFY